MARRATRAILVLVAACGTPNLDSAAAQRDASAPAVATAAPGAGSPSWSTAAWASRADRRDAVALELARDAAGATAVLAAARAADEPTVEHARTLARIGGADAAASLLELLERGDRQPSAGELAAVGLLEPPPGLPGEPREPDGVWSTLEHDLWTRFAVDEDVERMRASSFALARIGGAYSQGLWSVELAAPDPDSTRRVAVLEAIGIACARRHRLHDRSLPLFAALVEGPRSPERAAAIYALARCAAPSAESFAGSERAAWVERLTAVLGDDDAPLAWKALAALGEVPTAIPAAILGAEPTAFATEVEAVRALAGHASGRTAMIERLVKLDPLAQSGARINVVLTALQALRKPIEAAPELLAPLRPWAERIAAAPAADPRRRVELALVRCELLVLEAIAHEGHPALAHCSEDIDGLPPHHGAVLAVEAAATGLAGTERADVLLAAASDRRAAVAEAALSALADLDDPRVSASLRTALASSDVGVLAAAAGAIAARAADRSKRDPQAVAVLEAMLARVDDQQAIEARLSAIEALGAMARSAGGLQEGAPEGDEEGRVWLERTIVPLAADPNDAIRRAAWTALFGFDELRTRFAAAVPTSFPSGFAPAVHAALEQRPATGLRIHTALGQLVIAFADAPAPIAQASLVALARAGRFDGLRFHRVVPGFVVQGGDPRGDGYGGPGWVLPCEWSELRYERGTVGIALAGKDTGGSQFFIAQSRQPHLDGRFTVIGRLTEGLELVDLILPHERIDRVEVIEGSGS